VTDVVRGLFSNGYFPLFPWVLFPLTGFVVGSYLFRCEEKQQPSVLPLAVSGGCLVLISLGCVALRPLANENTKQFFTFGWTMFPPSAEYITRTLGATLLLLAAGHQWLDRQPLRSAWFARQSFFETLSKHSLSIYLLHHIVHIWPLWIYGVATGNEPTHFWRIAMPIAWSLPLSLACVLGCYALFAIADRWRLPSLEDAMRWLCDS
jgi:uncharacterized membrane protein